NEKKIMAASRCSVTVETTPTGSGSWTAELLMTHKAAGRIARARISGKTSSAASQEKANMGLSLSTKDIKPVDFGEVEVGSGKAVRSALMVNDGNEVISLQSIEVIAAENGLQRLEQGCMMDMDLKMGESCPVTLIWKPDYRGALSTDLIIRHTGRLGFVVVPIRGMARDPKAEADAAKGVGGATPSKGGGASGNVPLPPTADELEKMMSGGIPPLSADALPSSAMTPDFSPKAAPKTSGTYHLIGTVGNRALIYKPDGTTAIVAVGETIDTDQGKGVKITNVEPKKVEIFIDGKKKTLTLEAVSSLTSRAAEERQRAAEPKSKKDSSKNGGSKETGSDRNVVPLPTGK
ncbi:MAG TPA: hypothetical protein DCY07_06040, partial [Rhodospirillaceae bacterium]|nr:hypothetical protein [Rhodospirillaceae bacterium]